MKSILPILIIIFLIWTTAAANGITQSDPKDSTTKVKKEIDKIKEQLKQITGGISFSGLFDVTASGYKDNPNVFALGNFELDMEKTLGDNFQVAAALVFNNDGGQLAAGFIDFHLFGGPVAARGRLFTQRGLHFQVGRFDVPVGLDWQYFAATDRITVTSPLTTEQIMDGGYNDVGLRILKADILYNISAYMLRGIEEGIAYGGRVGFTPFNNPYTLKKGELGHLELGLSYIKDTSRNGSREEKVLALDIESKVGPLHLQGEWLRKNNDILMVRLTGYHISSYFSIKLLEFPVILFGRYDSLITQPTTTPNLLENRLTRLTAGFNIDLFDIAKLKAEFLHYIKGNDSFFGSSFFIQLVISF